MQQPLDCMLPGRRCVQSKLPLRHIWEITRGVSPEQLRWCRLQSKCADPLRRGIFRWLVQSGDAPAWRRLAGTERQTNRRPLATKPVAPPSAALTRRDSNILQAETLVLMDCQTENQTSLSPLHKLNNQRVRVQAQQKRKGFFSACQFALRAASNLRDECAWPHPPPTDRLIACPEKDLTHGKICTDPEKDTF